MGGAGSVQLYFVIGVINVFCTTLTVLFVTHSLGNGCINHQGCQFFCTNVSANLQDIRHFATLLMMRVIMRIIVAGSQVVFSQPTNGSALQAGGHFLSSHQHHYVDLLEQHLISLVSPSNFMSAIVGVARASSTDVAPNQISGIDYLR